MNPGRLLRILLVDGTNTVHAWPALLSLHRKNKELARTELCRILTALQDASSYHVAVVFDGRGSRIEASGGGSEIQVFFSDSAHSADSVIERLAAKYAPHYDIEVATDDREIQNHVVALGGSFLSTASLRDLAQRHDDEFRRRHRIG